MKQGLEQLIIAYRETWFELVGRKEELEAVIRDLEELHKKTK